MPNGRAGDNPLTDLIAHGAHPFPADIEAMLLRIEQLGREAGRYPLGENWPFSPMEFDWQKGRALDRARILLADMVAMMEAGRGDEVLLDGHTRKPFVRRAAAALPGAAAEGRRGKASLPFVVAHAKAIMVAAGLLTCSMIYAVIAPEAAQRQMFGEALRGPLADVIVRNWAALIVIGGVMLIHGAFDPQSRRPILTITALGKAAFIALVLAQGGRYISQQAVVAVVCDSVMVVLFVAYLVGVRKGEPER